MNLVGAEATPYIGQADGMVINDGNIQVH